MRAMVKLPSACVITGAGVAVGSVVADTYSTDREKQQPFGTLMIAVEVTLPKVSAAAGVKIALLVMRGSPLTVIATAMGPAVPPSGMLTFPL